MATNFKIPSFQENFESWIAQNKDILGENIDVSTTSINYLINQPILLLLQYTNDRLNSIVNNMNIFTAEGIALDNILTGNQNFPRLQPSFASVKITCKGQSLLNVEAGDIVIESNGIEYTNPAFKLSDVGITLISFEALTAGENGNDIKPTDTIKIIKKPAQIFEIIVSEEGAGGRDQENDESYLDRWLNSNYGEWREDAIRAELLTVPGVKYARVKTNRLMEKVEFDLQLEKVINEMVPKSIYCIIEGGTDEEIGEAIFKMHDFAVETNGLKETEVINKQGDKKIIRFDRPVLRQIEYRKKYELNNIEINDTEIDIIIKDYIKSVGPGEYLKSFRIQEILKNTYGSESFLYINIDFKRKDDKEASFEQTLLLDIREKAEGVLNNE